MSKSKDKKKGTGVGNFPVANLVPDEVKERQEYRKAKKLGIRILVGALIVAVIGTLGLLGIKTEKKIQLNSAQNDSARIAATQGKYADITKMQVQIQTIESARQLAAANEIDWGSFLSKVTSSLPSGSSFVNFQLQTTPVSTTGSSSTSSSAPSTGTTGTTAAATNLVFTTTFQTQNLQNVSTFKNNLAKIPGFESATFPSVTQSTGVYAVTGTITFGKGLLWNRFEPTTVKKAK